MNDMNDKEFLASAGVMIMIFVLTYAGMAVLP